MKLRVTVSTCRRIWYRVQGSVSQLSWTTIASECCSENIERYDNFQSICSSALPHCLSRLSLPTHTTIFTLHKFSQVFITCSIIGLFTATDTESLVAEIIKMKDFQHSNVMSLIGVCLDAGPGVSIVMPFMTNGSLLDYLKRERNNIYLPETSEIDEVSSLFRSTTMLLFHSNHWLYTLQKNKQTNYYLLFVIVDSNA